MNCHVSKIPQLSSKQTGNCFPTYVITIIIVLYVAVIFMPLIIFLSSYCYYYQLGGMTKSLYTATVNAHSMTDNPLSATSTAVSASRRSRPKCPSTLWLRGVAWVVFGSGVTFAGCAPSNAVTSVI